MTRKSLFLAFLALFTLLCDPSQAQETGQSAVPEAFHATALPLPRFVSLQASEVYVRTGPGAKYPIEWIYKRAGLPVEIILEYEVWRKIRDIKGDTGWVHQTLLSGQRRGVLIGEDIIDVRQKPRDDARATARIEPGAMFDLQECQAQWCKIEAEGYDGWIQREHIWGAYRDENFD